MSDSGLRKPRALVLSRKGNHGDIYWSDAIEDYFFLLITSYFGLVLYQLIRKVV